MLKNVNAVGIIYGLIILIKRVLKLVDEDKTRTLRVNITEKGREKILIEGLKKRIDSGKIEERQTECTRKLEYAISTIGTVGLESLLVEIHDEFLLKLIGNSLSLVYEYKTLSNYEMSYRACAIIACQFIDLYSKETGAGPYLYVWYRY